MSSQFLLSSDFVEGSELNANSVDPNQTCAVSDLGLYCLPLALLWDARPRWVYTDNIEYTDQMTQI